MYTYIYIYIDINNFRYLKIICNLLFNNIQIKKIYYKLEVILL